MIAQMKKVNGWDRDTLTAQEIDHFCLEHHRVACDEGNEKMSQSDMVQKQRC